MPSPIERKPNNDKTIMPLRGEGNQNICGSKSHRLGQVGEMKSNELFNKEGDLHG